MSAVRFILVVAGFLIGLESEAAIGDSKGNGGYAVVCRDALNQINSIEFLDHYEGREARGFTIDVKGTSLDDRVQRLLERLSVLDPERAGRYQKALAEFHSLSQFKEGVILPDPNDTFPLMIPVGCQIEVIVVQRVPVFPKDKRYIIQKSLWDRLSEVDQAGLVFHELIYGEAIAEGHTSSWDTRYLTGLWSSREFEAISFQEHVKRLSLVRFSHIFYGENGIGAWISVKREVEFFQDKQTVRKAYLSRPSELIVGGVKGTYSTGSLVEWDAKANVIQVVPPR